MNIDMADDTLIADELHRRPHSVASSARSSLSADSERQHDWVARQMQLRRLEYIEPLNIHVKIVSWNVNGKRIVEDLTTLLLEDIEPGIYAIG
jgi:hypothetical protein